MELNQATPPAGDVLSPLARDVMALNGAAAYGQLVASGSGNAQAKQKLGSIEPAQLVIGPVVNANGAEAMLAGLWLWHDDLEASHAISQGVHTPTGSYWHAILHRREGDFGNTKYWNARCRNHPILASLARAAAIVVHPLPADKRLLRLVRDGWEPDAFVDLCESLQNTPNDPLYSIAVGLQKTEWRILFDHSTREATGK